jgi:aerobic-type carbon monoxide dehydrogenase small subunit (CoxS/CutS family)
MTAVALVRRKQAAGQKVTDADLDRIGNTCWCGTYARIREPIVAGEAAMHARRPQTHKKPIRKHKAPTAG